MCVCEREREGRKVVYLRETKNRKERERLVYVLYICMSMHTCTCALYKQHVSIQLMMWGHRDVRVCVWLLSGKVSLVWAAHFNGGILYIGLVV